MAEVNRHATDVVGDELVGLYSKGIRRLEDLVREGLRRGLDPERIGAGEAIRGDATQAYRERQLAEARTVVAELERGARAAPVVGARAYRAGMVAVDRVTIAGGAAAVGGAFGGVHQRAVEVLGSNLGANLERAAGRVGQNVETVFARAAMLEGGLSVRNTPGPAGAPFIGRRVDDPWRKVALEELGAGQVALETRRQITANLIGRLVEEGIADAVTGFVDAGGARWALDRYAAMVTRTTTREATSRATVNRLTEHGLDLVEISSHPHTADECTPYDGQTFSLDGATAGYDELDELPPFHPNCLHVVTPAGANLDDFENELEEAANGVTPEEPPAPPTSPAVPPVPSGGPAAAEFGPVPFGAESAEPAVSTATARRKASADFVDALAAADPGPEGIEARRAWQDAEAKGAKSAERAEARAASRAIDNALGPNMVAVLDDLAKSGVKWARDEDLKRALIEGETTIDDVIKLAEEDLAAMEGRRHHREELKEHDGLEKKAFPCFVCGRFKRRPADVCEWCGDDPVSYRGDAHEFNRFYGYAF